MDYRRNNPRMLVTPFLGIMASTSPLETDEIKDPLRLNCDLYGKRSRRRFEFDGLDLNARGERNSIISSANGGWEA